MDTRERAGRAGGAAGSEGARRREREDGDGWKAMDRWTVRQDGEDRWTDIEGRRWMGTRGRGDQIWDIGRKGSRQHPGRLQASDPGRDRQQSRHGGSRECPSDPGNPTPPPPALPVVWKGLSHKAEVTASPPTSLGELPPFLPLVWGGGRKRVLPAPMVLSGFLWAPPGCCAGLPEVCVWPPSLLLGVTP